MVEQRFLHQARREELLRTELGTEASEQQFRNPEKRGALPPKNELRVPELMTWWQGH